MSEVTRLLEGAAAGEPRAAEALLPLVYAELRRLAAARLAGEKAGHTLQPTALVHEAYLRLVGAGSVSAGPEFNGRGHFFAAAAEAMRRILVESARRKGRVRHGGSRRRIELNDAVASADGPADELLDLDDALTRLEAADPVAAGVVKLRYFAGLSMPEAAAAMGLPLRTAERNWTYARTWLHRELSRTI
jgi:RNA polymerase sigma factor (TIGR02999 family)